MISILNASMERVAIIKDIINPWRFEEINGENKLEFKAILSEKVANNLVETNIVEFNNDYFDIAYYSKDINEDGTATISTECEHISYRLNDEQYNLDYFAYTGTPTQVLAQVLNGTGFTVGALEYADNITYSAQEKKSRRSLLMGLVALLGGEVIFNKFSVSILNRRGSTDLQIFTKGKNIEVISKVFDGRVQPNKIAYTCTPIVLPNKDINLGDDVLLVQPELGIQDTLRVVMVGYNPLDTMEKEIEIANFINGLEDQLYRIETSSVIKGKSYYGARISPENGFESIRNDKMARSVFNADMFAMQVGDGTGTSWTDKLYFDPALGKYVFDGELSADIINALSVLITPNLYAGKATISELTVDQLDTSTKVQHYLNSDTSDVNYIRIQNQTLEFVTASTDGLTTEQVTDRYGVGLYWLDATYASATTAITEYPVMVYVYAEGVKLGMTFDPISPHVPKITLGVGTGVVDHPDYGVGYIYKGVDGLYIEYRHGVTGAPHIIKLTDEGIDLTDFEAIKYSETVAVTGVPQIWVQPEVPNAAKNKDVWIETDNYSRYDIIPLVTGTTLVIGSNEFITASGTFTITLHAATLAGIIKKIYNVGTGIITIAGTINGVVNMVLYPNESVELITDEIGWRY